MSAVAGTQKPGLRAHQEATRASVPELVTGLREIVGVRLVAYLGNVKSTRAVAEWADGARKPGETDVDRLRLAYQVAILLREQNEAVTVQSWFKGMNPALGDVSPARVLREGAPDAVGPDVMGAAKAFAFVG
ncbi:hypothetical protein GSU69_01725 [Rathayibacter festucae]|jgi:hypothetical protein|uniref:Antitoxin Xre/MbcA/ParS-like toxin-binding domain-containing protein n=1 Tax=Rathayibacter festucae TaxID=110937 RepID=A0ABX6GVN7_9MICO|nr:hypothetical protein [Rathayibacter festucae]QHC61547.1 hypothetical protein GSU69_01725 [Rathayibacter festucae]